MDQIELTPLTANCWDDALALFGDHGICGGCWCMWWRKSAKRYEADKGAANRDDLHDLACGPRSPGYLFYHSGAVIGWCSIGPRSDYGRLNRSRILAPIDDADVWSLVCLHILPAYRRQGLSARLVAMSAAQAFADGASIIEAYPHEPKKPDMPAVFAQTWFRSAFDAAGFVEVARRSDNRPIMRLHRPASHG